MKMEQNLLKNKLKYLFKEIDSNRSGTVSSQVFFEILKLHKIRLSNTARDYILN